MSGSSNINTNLVSDMADSLRAAYNSYDSNADLCASILAFAALESAGFDISCCKEYDASVKALKETLNNTAQALASYVAGCDGVDKNIEDSIPEEDEENDDVVAGTKEIDTTDDTENMSMEDLEKKKEDISNTDNKDGKSGELDDEHKEKKKDLDGIDNDKDTKEKDLDDFKKDDKEKDFKNINKNKNTPNINEKLDNFLREIKNMDSNKKNALYNSLKSFADKQKISLIELIDSDKYIEDIFTIFNNNNFSVSIDLFRDENCKKKIRETLKTVFVNNNSSVNA